MWLRKLSYIQESHKSSEGSLDQKAVQQSPEISLPEAATLGIFGRLKKRFEQLSGIHGKRRSQKEKDFVGTQTLIAAEVTLMYYTV